MFLSKAIHWPLVQQGSRQYKRNMQAATSTCIHDVVAFVLSHDVAAEL